MWQLSNKDTYQLTTKVVAVSWNDAHYNTDEVDSNDITHRPWVYTTVGVLVRSDEVGVTLSCDVGEDGRLRGRNFVPRAMVIDEWEVGALAKKRKVTRTRKSIEVVHEG